MSTSKFNIYIKSSTKFYAQFCTVSTKGGTENNFILRKKYFKNYKMDADSFFFSFFL